MDGLTDFGFKSVLVPEFKTFMEGTGISFFKIIKRMILITRPIDLLLNTSMSKFLTG